MITNKTMKIFTNTSTMLTRSDSLMPIVINTHRAATSNDASQWNGPTVTEKPLPPSRWTRVSTYSAQPWATTLAPSSSSSIRSQPMIHATISPRLA